MTVATTWKDPRPILIIGTQSFSTFFRYVFDYSECLKSEHSDFGVFRFGSIVKQFRFQTVSEIRKKVLISDVWFGPYIRPKRNKQFGFQTLSEIGTIYFGLGHQERLKTTKLKPSDFRVSEIQTLSAKFSRPERLKTKRLITEHFCVRFLKWKVRFSDSHCTYLHYITVWIKSEGVRIWLKLTLLLQFSIKFMSMMQKMMFTYSTI